MVEEIEIMSVSCHESTGCWYRQTVIGKFSTTDDLSLLDPYSIYYISPTREDRGKDWSKAYEFIEERILFWVNMNPAIKERYLEVYKQDPVPDRGKQMTGLFVNFIDFEKIRNQAILLTKKIMNERPEFISCQLFYKTTQEL